MGKAVSRGAFVADVTVVPDMGTARVDAPGVDAANMRAARVTDMRATAVVRETAHMGAADVRRATADVRRATAEMRPAATEVGATATKVWGATTTAEVNATATATEVGATAATTTKVRPPAAAATKMRRRDGKREGGNAEGQSGRQSSNNPTRHCSAPTI
jgi:hypothetical protein